MFTPCFTQLHQMSKCAYNSPTLRLICGALLLSVPVATRALVMIMIKNIFFEIILEMKKSRNIVLEIILVMIIINNIPF